MKKELLDRLKKYGLSSAAALASTTAADAQMIYTDIVPDDTVSGSGFYALDLDNNTVNDFNFQIYTYSYSGTFFNFWSNSLGAQALGNNDLMLDSSWYLAVLNSGASIGPSASWGSNGNMVSSYFVSFSSSTYQGSYGPWAGATDKYVGLKLVVGGSTHYGWARITVLGADEFIIKDYAYQLGANVSVLAGDTSSAAPAAASPAMNVVGTDVANNQNGLDLQVSFDTAANESSITQYRILVVKEADTAGFDLATAQGIPSANYTAVTPNGSNITQVLNANSKDVDGDLIQENVPYRVYILSKADGTTVFLNALSEMSNQVILTTPIIPCDPVTNVVGSDVANNGNGTDMLVEFNKAQDESGIAQYKICVVKAANASTFDLAQAQSLLTLQYTNVTPTGSNISTVLSQNMQDTDGDLIEDNQPYRVFVLSIANNINATIDTLSQMSNEVTLIGPVADIATDLTLSDVGNAGNGEDLNLTFTKAPDESTIDVYRLMVVKSANASSFDLAAAEAVTSGNYGSYFPNGSNGDHDFFSGSRDVDGQLITENVPYKAFVLSMADGTNATINSLSGESNEVILDGSTGLPAIGQAGMTVKQTTVGVEIMSPELVIDAYRLVDVQGRILSGGTLGKKQCMVSTEQLATGVYFIRVSTEQGSFVHKFVLSH